MPEPPAGLTQALLSRGQRVVELTDQPVVDCAYGYQEENQEKADEIEENCGQERGADEERGSEEAR